MDNHHPTAQRQGTMIHARTILSFSGGAGSWAAGRKWLDEGGAPLELLFTDTLCEDQDTYRFLIAGAANLLSVELPPGFLPEIADFPAWDDRTAYKAFVLALAARTMRLLPAFHWLSNGEDVWDVFERRRFLGNSRVDPCSETLKRKVADRWHTEHCDKASTVFLVGLGPDEPERMLGAPKFGRLGLKARTAADGWCFEAPLIDGTAWWPHRVEAEVIKAGLWEQRLYRLGFSHANCGGGCCKAGIGQWRLLMRAFPERYAYAERREAEIRDMLGDVSMLKDRRGGTTKSLSLSQLRERDITPAEAADMGGCRCMTGDDPDLDNDAGVNPPPMAPSFDDLGADLRGDVFVEV